MKHLKNISKSRIIIYCAAVFLVFIAILLPDKYCGSEVQNTDMQDVTDNKDGLDFKECFLDIHVGFGGKTVIPDPAKTDGKVSVSLLSSKNTDKLYKKNGYLHLVTDLSFAGFKKPVFVSSYAAGDMTEKSGMVSYITKKTDKGIKKKKIHGSCLVLFVTTNLEKHKEYENFTENYIVILDYKNGVSYKKKSNLHCDNYYSICLVTFSLADVTGNGVQELMVSHPGGKAIDYGLYYADKDTHKIKTIYDETDDFEKNFQKPGWDVIDCLEFKGELKDNYKAELKVPYIGYSKTISVIKDCGYTKKTLTNKMIDKWCINYIGMWKKNGKVRKKWAKKHGEVFLYTLNHISFIKGKDGNVQIEFKRPICIGHRSNCIGDMYIYMGYDKDLGKLVAKDAKYSKM